MRGNVTQILPPSGGGPSDEDLHDHNSYQKWDAATDTIVISATCPAASPVLAPTGEWLMCPLKLLKGPGISRAHVAT